MEVSETAGLQPQRLSGLKSEFKTSQNNLVREYLKKKNKKSEKRGLRIGLVDHLPT